MEPVGFFTDMWAVGVLAYVLLSGISPLAGDDDLGTINNIKAVKWSFDEESFKSVSENAKDFIRKLLIKNPQKRMTVHEALEHPWLTSLESASDKRIMSSRYTVVRKRMRQRWQDLPEGQLWISILANLGALLRSDAKKYKITDGQWDRKEAAPRFLQKPKNSAVLSGESARFECRVVAASAPLITWCKEEMALTQSAKYMQRYATTTSNTYELRINRVKMDDKGEYVVKAENSWGKREASFMLNVEEVRADTEPQEEVKKRTVRLEESAVTEQPQTKAAPLFTFRLRNRLIQEGGGVKLLCIVTGEPLPKVKWFKGDRELPASGGGCVLEQSVGICSLEITSCELSDAGRYSCKAENERGFDETNCSLVVEESRVKKVPGDIARLTRHSSASVERTSLPDSRSRKEKETTVTIKASSKTSEKISADGMSRSRTEEHTFYKKTVISASDEYQSTRSNSKRPSTLKSIDDHKPESEPTPESAPQPNNESNPAENAGEQSEKANEGEQENSVANGEQNSQEEVNGTTLDQNAIDALQNALG